MEPDLLNIIQATEFSPSERIYIYGETRRAIKRDRAYRRKKIQENFEIKLHDSNRRRILKELQESAVDFLIHSIRNKISKRNNNFDDAEIDILNNRNTYVIKSMKRKDLNHLFNIVQLQQ